MLCFLSSLGKLNCRDGLSDKFKVKQLKKSTYPGTQFLCLRACYAHTLHDDLHIFGLHNPALCPFGESVLK